MSDRLQAEKAALWLRKIREGKPVIHNITNYVVMNLTANALLALGASPVMAHALEEVEEMTALARALVLNIGTLSPLWVEAMVKAGKRAKALGIPVILDPVGSGATRFRTETARRIIEEIAPQVIRGNASEILSLSVSGAGGTKGVDSVHSVDQAEAAAQETAAKLNSTIVITGPIDLLTDGQRTWRVGNGHPLMGRITGSGCTATALIGAFLTAADDSLGAAAAALACFGLAGEKAALRSEGPASFQTALLDALYQLQEGELMSQADIRTD